jgi:hypothetical protein
LTLLQKRCQREAGTSWGKFFGSVQCQFQATIILDTGGKSSKTGRKTYSAN